MILNEPYFLTNKAWYYYDEEEMMYRLTDKATPEAKASYAEFYGEAERIEDGVVINA